MDQQLKFDILTKTIGSEAVDELKNKFGGLQHKLVEYASATYLAKKGMELIHSSFEKIEGIVEFGEQLAIISERTGISAQALSGFQAAAVRSNLSFEELQKGLKKFTQNLGDIGNNEKFGQSLKAIGVQAIDPVTKKLRDSGSVIGDISEKFENMENGPKKAALALDLFGKASDKMIPFLNEGKESLSKFGLQFSDTFAENAREFNDTMATIGLKMKQNFVDVVDGGLPKLVELSDALLGLFSRDQAGKNSIGDTIANGLSHALDFINLIVVEAKNLYSTFDALAQTIGTVIGAALGQILSLIEATGNAISDISQGKYKQAITNFSNFGKNFGESMKGAGSGIAKIWADNEAKIVKNYEAAAKFSNKMEDIRNGVTEKSEHHKGTKKDAPEPVDNKYKKEHEAIDKFKEAQKEQIAIEQLKIDKYALSKAELDKLIISEQLYGQAKKESVGWTPKATAEMKLATEAVIKQKQALIDAQEQQKQTFEVGARTALRDYVEKLRDVASQTKDMFTRAFTNMEDALVNFVKTGKLSFQSFANAIIDDLIRIAVRQATLGVLTSIGIGVAGAGGTAAAAGGGGGGYLGVNTNFSSSANSNVISKAGVMPLSRFATGGVVNQPHMALFGEAGPEAFVPLPDGRSIPVSMKGGSGAGNVSVVVQVNMASGEEKTSGDKDAQGLGKAISVAVKNEISTQMRPGGMLYGRV